MLNHVKMPARTARRRRTGSRGGCEPLLPERPKGARWMPPPRAGVLWGTGGAVAGAGLPVRCAALVDDLRGAQRRRRRPHPAPRPAPSLRASHCGRLPRAGSHRASSPTSTPTCGSQAGPTSRAPSGMAPHAARCRGCGPWGGSFSFRGLAVGPSGGLRQPSAPRAHPRPPLCPAPKRRSWGWVRAGLQSARAQVSLRGRLWPERSRGPVAGVGPPVRRWRAGLTFGGCCHPTRRGRRRVRTVPAPARRRRAGPEGPGDASASAVGTPPVAGPRGACGRARVRRAVRVVHRVARWPIADIAVGTGPPTTCGSWPPVRGEASCPGAGLTRLRRAQRRRPTVLAPRSAGLPRRGRSFIQRPHVRRTP